MKKRFLLTLLVITMSIIVFGTISASAETEGIYTYTVSNGKATITKCNSSASGEIVIPDTLGGCPVTRIGDDAFFNCNSLTSIEVDEKNEYYTSIDGNLFNKDGKTLIKYAGGKTESTYKIPDGVTEIKEYAFSGCESLLSVTIPDSVTSIGNSAFEDCYSLVSVTIPDRVTSIGSSAFSFCKSLVSVKIPDSVTSIGDFAFYGCDSLISVTIPDSVTSIGDYAFSYCDSLVSVTIPDSVTSIGNDTFRYCNSLKKVNITDLKAWCNVSFGNSYSNPLSNGGELYLNGNLVTDITIPDDVTSIGYSAFWGCASLVSVTIPDSVTIIGDSAFYENRNLKYVALPVEIKYIRNDAFNYCDNITTVFYAGSETNWENIVFYSRNENLTNAKIVYNATKKTYKFDTNCDAKIDDITGYAISTMPTVQNGEMTLFGWYDNASLSGEPVAFPYYGEATTLYAAWADRTGKTFDDAFITKTNQEYTVTTTERGQLVYFEFVPNLSKEYRFYTTGSKDTYGYLYNSNKSKIASNDDDGDGNNFCISYNLTAGETYYIAAKIYSGTGTFTFVVEEPVDYRINEITIKDMAGNSLQAIPTGTFLATVSFTNVSSSSDTVIILAQYTDSGAFKGSMYVQTEDVPVGSTIKLSIPVDNSKGDVAKLKAFCWESFGSLTPIGNPVSFPVE